MEYADFLVETVRQVPYKLVEQKTLAIKGKSIQQKLADLYVEECLQRTGDEQVILSSNLLQVLVKRDKLTTLVVNLYPGNDGYSIMLRSKAGTNDTETIKLPYEESELLDYIDNAELPPMLIELLERCQVNVFYSGCVIVELRDYRRSTLGAYDVQYILLKPTQETIINDINSLTNDGYLWTQEDRFQLESQILLSTQEPLCLDPSPTIFYVKNQLEYDHNKFNTSSIKRCVKKFSQVAINRKRKFSQMPGPSELSLFQFLSSKTDRLKSFSAVKNIKMGVDIFKRKPLLLSMPSHIDVDKYSKILDRPRVTADNSPLFIEEYILERERSQIKAHQTKSMYTKVSVFKRPSDDFFLGELYIDHDYVDGVSKGKSCKFPFGSRSLVDRYISQLIEIFTEGGRLFARVTHTKAGKPAEVLYAHSNSLLSSSSVTLTPAEQYIAIQQNVAYSATVNVEESTSDLIPPTTPGSNLVSPVTPTSGHNLLSPPFNLVPGHDNQLQHLIQNTPTQLHSTKQNRGQGKISSSSSISIATPNVSSLPNYPPNYPSPLKLNQSMPPPLISSPQPLVTVALSSPVSNPQATTLVMTTIASGNIQSPGVNITNLSGLPAGFNIQNLAHLQSQIGNLSNFQNRQGNQVVIPPGQSQLSISTPSTSTFSYSVSTTSDNSSASCVSTALPTSVFSLPIAMATGLNQLVSANLKMSGSKNVQGQTVFQMPNQQSMQLLGLSQKGHILPAAGKPPPLIPVDSAISVTSGASSYATQSPQNDGFSAIIGNYGNTAQYQPHIAAVDNSALIRQSTQSLVVSQALVQQQMSGLQPNPTQHIVLNSNQPVNISQNYGDISQNIPQNITANPQAISLLQHQNITGLLQNVNQVSNQVPNLSALQQSNVSAVNPGLTFSALNQSVNLSGLNQPQNIILNQSQNLANLHTSQNLSTLNQPQNISGLKQNINLSDINQINQNISGLNILGLSQTGLTPSNLSQTVFSQSSLPNQITMGFKGSSNTLNQQQLINLSNLSPQTLTAQQIQQLALQQRQLQLRQPTPGLSGLNIQQQHQSVASTSKYKRCKRGTPTPPKAP